MTLWNDAALIEALGALPAPAPPPVEALLARAVPDGPRRPTRAPALAMAASAVVAAALPLVLPTAPETRAWSEGLARRGVELSTVLIERLGKE